MIKFFIKNLINIPKSIWFNFRVFPMRTAIKLPVLLSYNTEICGAYKGAVSIESDSIKPGMIIYGIGGVEGVSHKRKSYLRFGRQTEPRIVFKGRAYFGTGCMISVDRGLLIIGDNFSANNNLYISCNKGVEFGNNVTLGWNINIMDSDNHTVIFENMPKVSTKKIVIGNNVWIASYADILKGAVIGDNSILAYRSCLTKAFSDKNLLIGGAPARVLSENTTWSVEADYNG